MNQACIDGDLELVKTFGLPEDSRAIYYSSLHGHLHIVKYLISIKAPIDASAIGIASTYGYLDIVKYLVSVNSPVDANAIFCTLDRINCLRRSFVPPHVLQNTLIEIIKFLLWNGAPYELDVSSFIKKIRLEFEPVISEFIGPDITSIIIQFLI